MTVWYLGRRANMTHLENEDKPETEHDDDVGGGQDAHRLNPVFTRVDLKGDGDRLEGGDYHGAVDRDGEYVCG